MIPKRDWIHPKKLRTIWLAGRYTLMPASRLSALWDYAGEASRLDGAFVECGTYKGGSAAVLISRAGERDVWLFDSWEGCPEPSPYDVDKNGHRGNAGEFHSSEEDVVELLAKLGPFVARVHRVKGWFEETVPVSVGAIGPIALLHLDGDWYESTKACLNGLYSLLLPGGLLVIDDYGYWEGCRRAVDEFFVGSPNSVKRIDDTQVLHVKPT